MARFFTVEQASNILGTTDRTVRRMLGDGRLSGSQHMEKGKLVWRVHATKELLERLPVASVESTEEVVDVDMGADGEVNFEPPKDGASWQQDARKQTDNMAEHFWNEVASKFLDRISAQDQLIGSLQTELDDKERQLRLLPDLQKQAEAERLAAETKALEVEALRKQIAAMEEKQAVAFEESEQAWKQQIAALKLKQAAAIEQERLAAAEIERVKSEKEAEAKAVQEQLVALSTKLAKLEQPWWKKWLAPDKD